MVYYDSDETLRQLGYRADHCSVETLDKVEFMTYMKKSDTESFGVVLYLKAYVNTKAV